jgi:hypothetical protein
MDEYRRLETVRSRFCVVMNKNQSGPQKAGLAENTTLNDVKPQLLSKSDIANGYNSNDEEQHAYIRRNIEATKTDRGADRGSAEDNLTETSSDAPKIQGRADDEAGARSNAKEYPPASLPQIPGRNHLKSEAPK